MGSLAGFYTVNNWEKTSDHHVVAHLTIHEDHPIFSGHFPGNPVTPGVCMMQIIKELGENWTQSTLLLKMARNVKFLAIINPKKNKNIRVELLFEEEMEDTIAIKSTTTYDETVALRFSGIFQKIQ